ncbi:MAG: family 20 glycosylhydrolase [Victivallales bacterium]
MKYPNDKVPENGQGGFIRGFLIHMSHYDPKWCTGKEQEKPFNPDTAQKVIDALAAVNMNMLIVDCADGVKYSSHPELKRHYTVPMKTLEELVNYARARNIEIVPKLNFAQSGFHRHNHWMYPYNDYTGGMDIFESEKYWKIGFELIDELIEVCKPERFFHIGMDEDNDRSFRQFKEAIKILHDGLAARKLRSIIWRDSRQDPRGEIFTEKHNAVEDFIPEDIIRIIWRYSGNLPEKTLVNSVQKGFDFWGAPGLETENILAWKQAVLRYGGKGMIMTKWVKCVKENEKEILRLILDKGKLYLS